MNLGWGPKKAIVQGSAARLAEELSLIAWERRRSECGGLLWGRVVPVYHGLAVWVAAMTPGVGRGSAVEFEMTPESYVVGQELLRLARYPANLQELGLWHSHPGYGAFLSSVDEEYFQLCFPRDHMVSIVIDPLRFDRSVYAKSSDGVTSILGQLYEGEKYGSVPELDAASVWNFVEDRIDD